MMVLLKCCSKPPFFFKMATILQKIWTLIVWFQWKFLSRVKWCRLHDGTIEKIFQVAFLFSKHLLYKGNIHAICWIKFIAFDCIKCQVSDTGSWEPLVIHDLGFTKVSLNCCIDKIECFVFRAKNWEKGCTREENSDSRWEKDDRRRS